MNWWTDGCIPLVVVSGVLMIFNGGCLFVAMLWVMYLLKGWKTVQKYPSQRNCEEFAMQLIIGIVVVVVSVGVVIAAHIRY